MKPIALLPNIIMNELRHPTSFIVLITLKSYITITNSTNRNRIELRTNRSHLNLRSQQRQNDCGRIVKYLFHLKSYDLWSTAHLRRKRAHNQYDQERRTGNESTTVKLQIIRFELCPFVYRKSYGSPSVFAHLGIVDNPSASANAYYVASAAYMTS